MDFPDIPPAGKSPRQSLQGPRPTPLKVRKDSHKIRKPPVAPPSQHHPPPQAPPRPPVIIYTVSPKVIHANPSEFMTLVQRLTGPDHSTTCSSSAFMPHESSTSSFTSFYDQDQGAISPAARFASIEKTNKAAAEGKMKTSLLQSCDMAEMVEGIEISSEVERTGFFPGILSPNPASLPAVIPANFFSPPASDPNPLGSFFHDLSPILHSNNNRHYLESSLVLPSPSNFISPRISPTTPSLDLFNNIFDF